MRRTETQSAAGGRNPAIYLRVAIGAFIVMTAWSCTVTGLSFFTNPILVEHPEWKISTFTLYFTLYSLASGFIMPVAAKLIERIGAQRLVMLGGAIAAVGLLAFSMSNQLWMFYLAGLTAGIGVGLSIQFVPVLLVNRWFVAKRGLVLGIVLAGSGFGGTILGSALPPITTTFGWRTATLVLAAIMLAFTMLPAIFLIKNSPFDAGMIPYGADATPTVQLHRAEAEPGLTMTQAARTPWLYVLMISLALMGITHAMNQHVVNYLALRPYGIDVPTQTVSTAIVIASVSLIIYKPSLGFLVDKIGLSRALIITLSIAAVATYISAVTTTAWVYLVCVALFSMGFANGSVAPPLLTQAVFGERDYAKLWGVLGMAYPIGSAIGVPLWGMVRDVFGSYGYGFVAVPVVTIIFLTGYLTSMRGGKRLWADQPAAEQA